MPDEAVHLAAAYVGHCVNLAARSAAVAVCPVMVRPGAWGATTIGARCLRWLRIPREDIVIDHIRLERPGIALRVEREGVLGAGIVRAVVCESDDRHLRQRSGAHPRL